MKKLPITAPVYVIDTDQTLIVDVFHGDPNCARHTQKKAEARAQEYAQKTGHSVCVVKPVSWH